MQFGGAAQRREAMGEGWIGQTWRACVIVSSPRIWHLSDPKHLLFPRTRPVTTSVVLLLLTGVRFY